MSVAPATFEGHVTAWGLGCHLDHVGVQRPHYLWAHSDLRDFALPLGAVVTTGHSWTQVAAADCVWVQGSGASRVCADVCCPCYHRGPCELRVEAQGYAELVLHLPGTGRVASPTGELTPPLFPPLIDSCLPT